jgi:hypothetical protein
MGTAAIQVAYKCHEFFTHRRIFVKRERRDQQQTGNARGTTKGSFPGCCKRAGSFFEITGFSHEDLIYDRPEKLQISMPCSDVGTAIDNCTGSTRGGGMDNLFQSTGDRTRANLPYSGSRGPPALQLL